MAEGSCIKERITGRVTPDGLSYRTAEHNMSNMSYAGHFLDRKKADYWASKLNIDHATVVMVPGGMDEPGWALYVWYPPNTGGFKDKEEPKHLPGGFAY